MIYPYSTPIHPKLLIKLSQQLVIGNHILLLHLKTSLFLSFSSLSLFSVHPLTPTPRISIYLSIYPSIYLSVCLSIYPSICLAIDLSIYLSIYRGVGTMRIQNRSPFCFPSLRMRISLSVAHSSLHSIQNSVVTNYSNTSCDIRFIISHPSSYPTTIQHDA